MKKQNFTIVWLQLESEASVPPVVAAVAAKELLSLPPTDRAQITVFFAPTAWTLISQRIRERGGGGGRLTDTHSSSSLCLRSFKCEWDHNEQRGPALSQVASLTPRHFWSQLNITFYGGYKGRSEGGMNRGREWGVSRRRVDSEAWWETKCRVTDRKEEERRVVCQLGDRLTSICGFKWLLAKIVTFFSLSFHFCLVPNAKLMKLRQ